MTHSRTADGVLYLVMEWLDGLSLTERLAAGRLSVEEALELGERVADGLAEIHRAGLVHRDIKPDNLMLVGGRLDCVKIVDFGIARPLDAPGGITVAGHHHRNAGVHGPRAGARAPRPRLASRHLLSRRRALPCVDG